MSTDPATPDGGYALTPDQSATAGTAAAPSDASTAHHEQLLRTEAIAARRGNRAIARFAVAGLVTALAVGFITWRNAVPPADTSADSRDSSTVIDASVDTPLTTPQTRVPSEAAPRTGVPQQTAPPPVTIGGLATLSEDPYLPPNAWNGGASLAPGTTAPGSTPRNPGAATGTATPGTATGSPSTPGRPQLPDLPSFPGFPSFPDPTEGSSTGQSTTEETPGDAGEGADQDSDDQDSTDTPGSTTPDAPTTTEPTGPTEPTELN